jgi:hypothetical protein
VRRDEVDEPLRRTVGATRIPAARASAACRVMFLHTIDSMDYQVVEAIYYRGKERCDGHYPSATG